ncbi:hypothetical protein OG216_35425 [Streptomycetaceae bacterium NBC_01309]
MDSIQRVRSTLVAAAARPSARRLASVTFSACRSEARRTRTQVAGIHGAF